MTKLQQRILIVIVSSAFLASAFAAPDTPAQATALLLKKVSLKYSTSQAHAWEAAIEIARQRGESPRVVLASGKVQFASAPGRKYHLHVDPLEKTPGSEFERIADGKTEWTYLPARNEYLERPVQAAESARNPSESGEDVKPEARDLIAEFSLQLIPLLSNLVKSSDLSFVSGSVLTVISKKDPRGYQNLIYLTLDTDTLAISKLTWVKAMPYPGAKMLVRCDMTFRKFVAGAPAAAPFTFTPKDAKRVDVLTADAPGGEAAPSPQNPKQ